MLLSVVPFSEPVRLHRPVTSTSIRYTTYALHRLTRKIGEPVQQRRPWPISALLPTKTHTAHNLIKADWGGSSSFLSEGLDKYAEATATDPGMDLICGVPSLGNTVRGMAPHSPY